MKNQKPTLNAARHRVCGRKASSYLCALLCLVSALLCGTATAQSPTQRVQGVVVDAARQPVIGASVIIKGTSTGTSTNNEGKFSITARAGNTLIISMLGYSRKEVSVPAVGQVISVMLEEDVAMIDDIVVQIGYGEQRHRDITGTVGVVKIDDMAKAPVVSFDQALQGRVAGVSVTSSDGQPGSDMDIVIRGANSITQSNSPLYVVDGFPLEDFSNAAINQADIASISILKDASATAIYGSRGANGVIIIETKKGMEGRPVIKYGGTFGFQQVTKTMDMMEPYDFVLYQIEMNPTNFDKYLTKENRTLDFYKNHKGIDWQDKIFRNAPVYIHNLSLTGGNKQTRYVVSLGSTKQDGVITFSGYEKYQGRLRLDQQINKKMKFSANVTYTDDKTYGQTSSASLTSSNSYASYLMYRTWAFRPVMMSSNLIGDDNDMFDDVSNIGVMNPYMSNSNESKVRKSTTFFASGTVDYSIIKDLKLSIRGGYTKRVTRNEQFNNSNTYTGYPSANNNNGVNASFNEQTKTDWLNENTLSYRKTFGKNHRMDALAGFTMQGTDNNRYGFGTTHIPNEQLGMSGMDEGLAVNPSALISQNTLMSFLFRANYSYKSRYMFTASFRADGSSKFRPENRWGYFPSGAFAWRMGNEKFMKGVKFVDDAKLRVSYGAIGNNRIGDFDTYSSMSISDYYSFGNGVPGAAIIPTSPENKALKWETTVQADIGYDLTMFKGRVKLSVDLYRKTTKDLLLNANLPYTSGYRSVIKNVGKMRNDGLEITLGTVNIKRRGFEWTSDFNISFNKSKVLSLAEGQEIHLSKVGFTGDFNSTNLYLTRVGRPITQLYGVIWEGVYNYEDFDLQPSGSYRLKNNIPSNGNDRNTIQPGDVKYRDVNGDGIVNDQDMVVIGNPVPKHSGGFSNNFTYKNLSLNIFFQWSYGNDVFNANRIAFEGNFANRNINQYRSYNDHWRPETPYSKNHRPGGQGPRGVYSSKHVEDGSFLRLKTVQLSYNLPKLWVKKLGIENVNVFISGQNLYTWSNYSGLDPEVSTRHSALTPGYDYSAYARNKIYTAGVNITF